MLILVLRLPHEVEIDKHLAKTMKDKVMVLAAKYPEVQAEKSILKQLQMLGEKPSISPMKELKPLIVKLLKSYEIVTKRRSQHTEVEGPLGISLR